MKTSILLLLLPCLAIFLTAPALSEDPDYGDDPAAAHAIPTDGTVVSGLISHADDRDWFCFTPGGSARYRVSFLNEVANYKTIRVYQAGALEELWEVIAWGVWKEVAAKELFFDTSDAVYLCVEGETGRYSLKVEHLGNTPPDGYADTCQGAYELTVNAPPTIGTIAPDNEFGEDVDWFTFATRPLHKYLITLRHADNSWIWFSLYPSDCSADPLYGYTTYLTLVSLNGEDYRLLAEGAWYWYWQGNYYEIDVQEIEGCVDDHGNRPGQATAIPTDGTSVAGRIDYEADVGSDQDWFTFPASVGGAYTLTFDDLTDGNKLLEVFRSDELDGLVLIDQFWDWDEDNIHSLDLSAGRYYICVQYGMGRYSLGIESPEPRCGDANHPYPMGDVNKDCRVDLLDLAELAANWLTDVRPGGGE